LVLVHRIHLLLCFCLTLVLMGCGGRGSQQSSIFQQGQQLSVSSWYTNGASDQPFTAPRSSFVNQSCLSCIGMQVTSCTLHAGSTPMNFTATPSASWFAVTPGTGFVAADGTAQIGLAYINADGLPVSNAGTFMVSAAGYQNNNSLSFNFVCGTYAADGTEMCTLSLICPPCTLKSDGTVSCPY
jgi:uncharacterized lipoprotein NlpE involved in copper resistance